MGIQFNGTSNQNVKWSTATFATGLTQKSILTWFYYTAVPVTTFGTIWAIVRSASPHENTVLLHPASHLQKLGFTALWSGAEGFWRTTNNVFSAATLYHAAVTYDGGATTNDPIIYINGASEAITEITPPSGTYQVGITSDMYIGTPLTPPNSNILSICYYNRILSASEIADAYASKLAIPTWRGLVFAPQLHQRGEVGEGGTLTASHTIADAVSGALGTPSGSPLHKQDNYLRME